MSAGVGQAVGGEGCRIVHMAVAAISPDRRAVTLQSWIRDGPTVSLSTRDGTDPAGKQALAAAHATIRAP